MADETTHRIFFALWPDDTLRQQIQHTLTPYLARSQARRVPQHNWHITLAFLGNVTQPMYECVLGRADQVVGQSFSLTLDQFGYWPRPRVTWLGCTSLPKALAALVNNLNGLLATCGYKPEQRTYTPHLTLQRKANKGLDIDRFTPYYWHIEDFVLVESMQTDTGSVYNIVKRWQLKS